MELKRIVAPASDLVTLAQARDYLRITSVDEDAALQGYIATASAQLDARDGVLGEALVTQTWRLSMDAPAEVTLPIEPVQSIAAIRYLDADGVEQTFGAANYRLSGADVELVDGASWPTVADRSNAFWIDFVCGYGAAADVPATVRHTALLMIADFYENRAASGEAAGHSETFKMLFSASRSARGLF